MNNRLVSLELQGIKTFATTTLLEFPSRITAIVGPNGSGKSNIADSIRWVLGEQSYSLLRSRKTEDMIFSGSQQRSRAGMGSAKITFNNEDGWLPIDYSEVSISRRAYRDGQNEYLLNGQRVRLKDISELLSQTGLSERTYTIIGQGLVDVALAIRPDERRKLFEEAAGIGLYRSRKDEALRRLESTQKNLERVLDILAEIKPRLRSLERQAGRFDEFQRLRSDLQVHLRDWYGYHWHQLQQDLGNVRKTYQEQEKRLSELRGKNSEAERKVEEIRVILQEKRRALQSAHSELSEFHHQLEQTTRQLAIIDERQRSNTYQKSNLEIDIANVQEEISELTSQMQGLQEEIDLRVTEYEAAKDQVERAKAALADASEKKEAVEKQLEEARKTRVGLETERVQTKARIDELTHRFDSLANEKDRIEQILGTLTREKDDWLGQVDILEIAYQNAEEEYSLLEQRSGLLTKKLTEAQADIQTLDRELSDLATKHAKLQTQLEVLNQAEAALSGYSEGLKSIVSESKKGHLPKGIEPLSKYIMMDEKYEKAISAALGELTDLLIVPAGNRDEVIEYLDKKDNERVALVGIDHIQSKTLKERFSSHKGILGYANEVIEVDPKYKQLIDRLFSDTIIVDGQKSAREIQARLRGTEKAVTLNGMVFQADGIIFSGQSPTGKRIGRSRRLSEIQGELTQYQENINKLKDKKQELSQRINSLRADEHSLSLDLGLSDEAKVEAYQIRQQARENINRITEQVEWHTERLSDVKERITETQQAIQSNQGELEIVIANVNALQSSEREHLGSIGELPVIELQQTLNHWQTNLIVTTNAMEVAQRRFQDGQSRIEEVGARFETHQGRLAQIAENLTRTEEEKNQLRNQAQSLNQTIEQITTNRIKPFADQVDENENIVTQLEKLETDTHQQVIAAERHFTQLQLELSRQDDKLNHLRERIEDDFGLVSFDYDQKVDGPNPLPLGDDLVKDLPIVDSLSETTEINIKQLKSQLRRIGSVNPEAQQEYFDVKERFEFLTEQVQDLENASKDLHEVIETLDELMERDFLKTFKDVDKEFSEYFKRLFNGGDAKLVFLDNDSPVEGGVDIEARLPGRRQQGLALLSGGERSLTAVALIFALLKVSPTPFCILDEVDAMLDESNVGRFVDLLHELSEKIQFVIITHNRNTVQAADVIYGVTMGRDSTSQMISLKLEDVDEKYLE